VKWSGNDSSRIDGEKRRVIRMAGPRRRRRPIGRGSKQIRFADVADWTGIEGGGRFETKNGIDE
jgi:hypothetical protein